MADRPFGRTSAVMAFVVLAMTAAIPLSGCSLPRVPASARRPSAPRTVSLLPTPIVPPTASMTAAVAPHAIRAIEDSRERPVPATTRAERPLPLFEAAAGTNSWTFLVPLDSDSGPVSEFYMSRSGAVLTTVDSGHAESDLFSRGLRLVTAALGPGARTVAFKSAYDGVYGENGGHSALVFTHVTGSGKVGALVGPTAASTVTTFVVYRDARARALMLLMRM